MPPYSYDNIAQKEMSRKEFLTFVGLGLATLLGLANALKTIGHMQKSAAPRSRGKGYGQSAYGA